jgi:hypothetical protein
MWNVRLGWNWTETSQGKFFFENKGHNIKERELSILTNSVALALGGSFGEKAMAIYCSMKELIGWFLWGERACLGVWIKGGNVIGSELGVPRCKLVLNPAELPPKP